MMKYIIFTVLLFVSMVVTSCEEDFDELNDTNQRHIVFTFKTDSLFSHVLHSKDTYIMGGVNLLEQDYGLRITAYCYDLDDNLLCSDWLILRQLDDFQSIKLRHLYKEMTYRFVFVADIVKYDSFVDFYETWYQLGTKNWSDFYIYADNRDDNALNNILGFHYMEDQPANQIIEVDFTPIFYNGYCIFDNIDSIDRLSGYVAYCSSFKLKSMEWQRLNSLAYSFDYSNVKEKVMVKPISLSFADSLITVKLRTTTLHSVDSVYIDIYNKQRRPFVATFDCGKRELTNCIFY